MKFLVLLLAPLVLSGCLAGAAVGAAGAVVGTGVKVTGAVVGAGVKGTGAVIGAVTHHDRRRDDQDPH
jgi:hypothetical protein